MSYDEPSGPPSRHDGASFQHARDNRPLEVTEAAEPDQGSVSGGLVELRSAMEGLDDAVNAMTSVLQPILRDDSGAEKGESDSPARSPLGDEVWARANILRAETRRLNNLIHRIDL